MAVSGSISSTIFNTRRVIDNCFRQCRVPPQTVTPEMLEVAREQLYLLLSEASAKGTPLWCIDKQILAMYEGQNAVVCPTGTYDILNLMIRDVRRLTGTPSATEGTADNAFDGDTETSCTQVAAGGSITLELASETDVTTIGILPNATGTWSFVVETSDDGSSYQTIYSATSLSVTAGKWIWVDVSGDQLTVIDARARTDVGFIRLRAIAPTVLNVLEFFAGNTPDEINLSLINRDDYQNLPNKNMRSRPTEYWLDRQRDEPVIRLWPAADAASTFRQLIMTRKRRIMDVGTLTQTLDIPQDAYNQIIDILAWRVALKTPEVKEEVMPRVEKQAMLSEKTLWDGQSDKAPTRLTPNISPYTR